MIERGPMRRMAMLLSAVAIVACDGGEGPARDTTAAVAEVADTTANDDAPPPEIDQPWQELTSAQLTTYIKSLRYRPEGSSQTAHRDCIGAKASLECTLLIMPVQGVRNFDPGRLAKRGAVIARIENLGTRTDSVLGIEPDRIVYWFVGPDSTGAVVADLLDLTAERPRSVKRLAFRDCDQIDDPPHPETEAAFRSCAEQRVAAEAATDHNSSPWITCSLGCCYSDDPTGGP